MFAAWCGVAAAIAYSLGWRCAETMRRSPDNGATSWCYESQPFYHDSERRQLSLLLVFFAQGRELGVNS